MKPSTGEQGPKFAGRLAEMLRNIRHLSQPAIAEALAQLGQPSFRAKQIWAWMWTRHARSFDEMSDLPAALRTRLAEEFTLAAPEIEKWSESADGTVKYAIRLADGSIVESVLIVHKDRLTACISSQVGCSLDCAFCATGRMERLRNLYFDEIYGQAAIMDTEARVRFGRGLTNVVYMGMGEPLLNYREMMGSIERITAPDGLGMSPSRITVSTAGIGKMIKKLGEEKVKFGLALSLHAPTDVQRSSIMSINESNDLRTLAESLKSFTAETGQRVTLEYVLLQGINDSMTDADNLAHFSRSFASKVNLLEYNAVAGSGFNRTSRNGAYRFKERLEGQGVIANIRHSRGEDIDAACGQLAGKVQTIADAPIA